MKLELFESGPPPIGPSPILEFASVMARLAVIFGTPLVIAALVVLAVLLS